ncbi:MAG: flagellar basal body P-ring protein FlgI [Nevskiales bacterium]
MTRLRHLLTALLLLAPLAAQAERIKDIASLAGVRSNALVGYGLVVGLDGSGDQTSQAPFTVQSLKNMLAQLGVQVPDNVRPQLKNVAAVSIHADLPPFSKPGQRIDITVSSIGNAQSLRGGSLLMAPLKGADGQVYAIAQGSVVVGGFGAGGSDGSRISVNVPSSGRIPNGATVERAVPNQFNKPPELVFNLHDPDFTTASRMVQTINAYFGAPKAYAHDAVSVAVAAPTDPNLRITYVSQIENLRFNPGTAPAKVIINSRTGTIVIGGEVQVMPAAVAHGSIAVTITERPQVSQPAPFSDGETVVVPRSDIQIEGSPDGGRLFKLEAGTTLDEIVQTINQVGAAPGDLVAILEALKQAGALRAELEVI